MRRGPPPASTLLNHRRCVDPRPNAHPFSNANVQTFERETLEEMEGLGCQLGLFGRRRLLQGVATTPVQHGGEEGGREGGVYTDLQPAVTASRGGHAIAVASSSVTPP